MPDEVRDISIVVRATQAIASLTKMAVTLEDLQGATGKTDAQLRNVDRQILKAANTSTAAARTLGILKTELRNMSKEATSASSSIRNLETRLDTANKRIAVQRVQLETLRTANASLVKQNLSLADSYNKVAAASAKAMAVKPRVSGSGANPVGDDALTNSLRYSLYDVAATFGVVGAAATAASTAVFRAGIGFDKNFANVIRTSQVTGEAVNYLKEQFLDLQTEIPVTSADLATIGTLGAQMGVAAANLANFTEITAKFSATAGISVDESATALSRLDQLLPDVAGNYELLASTILRTGVNAVATESQIVRGTNQIAAMGRIAGLTTPEIVALSSTLSSLGFSPELQRSIVTSSFSKILTATSSVTAQTEKFGAVLNLTGREFKQAWSEDALGTYRDLMETIAGRGDAVTVLQDLGLASQRLTPNLLKLGQNVEVLDTALADTSDEWGKNNELSRQYGIIAGTVSAKIQILGQTWESLLVTLDESDTVLGPIIDGLTGIIKAMRSLAKTPGVSGLVTLASILGTLVGVTTLGAAGLAALAGGYIAIVNAQRGLAAATAVDTVAIGVNTAAVNANATSRARSALGIGAETLALEGNALAQVGNATAMNTAGTKMLGFASSVITALPTVLKFAGAIGAVLAVVTALATVVATAPDWTHDFAKSLAGIDTPEKTLVYDSGKLKESLVEVEKAAKAATEARKKQAAATKAAQKAAESGAGYDAYGTSTGAAPKTGGTSYNKGMDDYEYDPTYKADALKKDIFEEISALESLDAQYSAVNLVAREMGITTEYLLTNVMPDLGSLLGEGAVAGAELEAELERLEAATALWAASLGSSDEALAGLISGVASAGGAFISLGDLLTNAYDTSGDAGTGGGLNGFIKGLDTSITDFESFYGELGQLTQKGGVQLATLFAEQGPAAAQALTDSLSLTPEQISQIESQMTLAAFYASEEFANTFAATNSVLAQVWQKSGNDPAATAAFAEALSSSMKGGSVDPAAIAALEQKFGFTIDIGMLPTVDPLDVSNALANAQAAATAQPIMVPTLVDIGPNLSATTQEVQEWRVTEEGHVINLKVDPTTEEGEATLNEWRALQYADPVNMSLYVDTTAAASKIAVLKASAETLQLLLKNPSFKAPGASLVPNSPLKPGVATGGMLTRSGLHRSNYPGFASGTILRGPGTGTSDSILARLSTGEAVTKARAVRYYGPRMMEDINKMRFPKYATGFTPSYRGSGGGAPGQQVNVNVTQMYPTTRDPIKTLKQDAESVVAGIWT